MREFWFDALRELYPRIVTTRAEKCFDIDGVEIEIDEVKINIKMEELKEIAKGIKDEGILKNHIYSKYPLEKQTQDEKWVSAYSTKLKALEVKDLELNIVRMAEDIYAGKTLEEVLKDIPQEQKKMYEKLVKVAVRTQWMEDCIDEGQLAMSENREANFDAITYINL